MLNYSAELNPEQLAVVHSGDGPCLVLAGAGSGKTRTITYRVAYLLEKGVSPSNILLVTFTNKAAAEMTARVAKLTGIPKLPWSGTFHSIAFRLLKLYAPLIGYKNNFTVLDSDDCQALIKNCLKRLKIGSSKKFPSAAVLLSMFSFRRNANTTLADVLERKYPAWTNIEDDIALVSDEYEKAKRGANAMDFDDLLVYLLVLLNQPDIRRRYADQFQYILVDEYQDTNQLQAAIIKHLASVHHNVLVVGDDAQSIYSFRAADIKNILQFEQDYPGAKIFKIETNYRSTAEILALANNSIANNRELYKKELRSAGATGDKPIMHPELDQTSEAAYIVRKISALIEDGVPPREIAILFRAAFHSQRLELELVKAGIPYDYRGGIRFFERAHVKDVLSYLRVLNNPSDTAAWLRILLHEEGIGPVAADKLVSAIRESGNLADLPGLGYQILGERAQQGWKNFLSIWEGLWREWETDAANIQKLLARIIESNYAEYLAAEYVDADDRLNDLKQLLEFANTYDSLDTFLGEMSLSEAFATNGNKSVSADQKITLSTVHQAKGLEWSHVFIINVARGAFPNDRALREDDGLAEERRLFYVALTRAKHTLTLTYPMAGGGFGDMLAGPSPFLEELHPDLYDDQSLLSYNRTVLNDPDHDITYVSEDEPPLNIRPGSFLRDVDDL